MTIHFAAVGFSHNHIYNMTEILQNAGAKLVKSWDHDAQRHHAFSTRYPHVTPAQSLDEILDDPHIQLVVSADIPDQRAPLGIRVMHSSKDFLCAKPAFTTLDQIAKARQAHAKTGRKYIVYFGERLGNRATVKALEMVHTGMIGRVVHTSGFGPHRLGQSARPDWFFDASRYGGVLNDLASHQIDQFLHFTNSAAAQITAAQIGNLHHPQYPAFEDFGNLMLQSPHATGFIRVDWLTPNGLGTWGDVRLFVQGTEGYIELRKNIDLAGRTGENHLFLVDQNHTTYINCADVELPFAQQFLHDIKHRTETAIGQEHCFYVSELALKAQQQAIRLK